MTERPIRVLVLETSSRLRDVLGPLLLDAEAFEVSTSADLLTALQRIWCVRPDVIVLDQAMEGVDAIPFLRRLKAAPQPVPVVVLSGAAPADREMALRLLAEGAVSIAARPASEEGRSVDDAARELAEIVRDAARRWPGNLAPDLSR